MIYSLNDAIHPLKNCAQVKEMFQTKDLKVHLLTSSVVGFADNHAAHHVAGVEGIVEAAGAILLYLSPYCPELNPIEGIFSIVKGWL